LGSLSAFWANHRRLLGAAFLLAAGAVVLWRLRGALTPFILAGVLSYLLNPLVDTLSKRGFSRLAALWFIYAIVLLTGVVVIGLLVPAVVVELGRLADFLPGFFRDLQQMAFDFQSRYSQVQLPQPVRQAIDDAILTVQTQLLRVISLAAQRVLGVFSALLSLLLAPILSFYILKDLDYFRARARTLIPRPERRETWDILSEVDKVVSGFVRGQLIVAAAVGVLVALGLSLLGIRFSVILGTVAGIAEIIPYFGPVIGALPALAVAASMSAVDAVKVLLMVGGVQWVEGNLLAPRIIGRRVGLHPVVVVFALLVGFELSGILGMIAAVPVAGILRVLLVRLLANRAAPG